jgi:hypothetical protein
MVKHGPRKRPICRQPRIFARSCVRVSGVDRLEISANNGGYEQKTQIQKKQKENLFLTTKPIPIPAINRERTRI